MGINFSIRGVPYEATVGSNGWFYVDVNGEQVKAETLASVKLILARMSSKVSVPYSRYISGLGTRLGEISDGEITGRHLDGHRILVRENGRAKQFHRTEVRGMLRRLSDDERAELARLDRAAVEAARRLEEFVDAYSVSSYVNELIDKAIAESMDKGGDDGGAVQEGS